MIENGLRIAVFKTRKAGSVDNLLNSIKQYLFRSTPYCILGERLLLLKQLKAIELESDFLL